MKVASALVDALRVLERLLEHRYACECGWSPADPGEPCPTQVAKDLLARYKR